MTHHHRFRSVLTLVAAVAGGLGILGFAFALIGTITPGQAAWLWAGSALLITVWIAGGVFRADSPDVRERQRERERRGY